MRGYTANQPGWRGGNSPGAGATDEDHGGWLVGSSREKGSGGSREQRSGFTRMRAGGHENEGSGVKVFAPRREMGEIESNINFELKNNLKLNHVNLGRVAWTDVAIYFL